MVQFLLSNSGREVDVDSKDRQGKHHMSLLRSLVFSAQVLSVVKLPLEDTAITGSKG